jgi:alpha-mannosidase
MKSRAYHIWMPILFGTVLGASACTRKIETSRIQINILQDKTAATYVNGYRKTVSGQVLAYHSSHPDADSALLVRANKEVPSISWETDALPAAVEGDSYRLVWLAGLDRAGWPGKEVHTFDFYINDQLWFTFKNLKDDTAQKWKVTGKQGAELSFEATMVDRAGDLFGYMFLKVPRSEAKPGLPLALRVQGRDENSLDWYMVLQYSFRFTPTLRAEPALTAQGKQLLRLSFDNLQEGRAMEVSAEGMEPVKQALKVGANILYVSIPAVELVHEIPVVISLNGELAQRTALWLKPVNRRELYLLSYSHNDIGYTDIQPNIEKKQWQNLDEALRLIKQTQAYPWEARYKWNMEVMWPLEGYLAQASEQKRQEVIQAVRDGNLGLNALYANVLTGLANAPEMAHFTDYARRFSEQYRAPITTALVSDIPGFTWGIVPALAHSGVKYFASAPNSGDRIGHVLEQWGDKPFYWTSQSGKEKVLMWVAGASYASFHEGDLSRLGDEKLLRLMRKLDDGGYPYEILQLPYTVGGDNGPPDPNLSDFVKKWNERYASPRLIIATHAQMFADFEKRHGASLPTMTGDFTPYWEDGAASTAAETALTRHAVDRLIQNEALFAMRAPASFPAEEFQAAWRNVVLWDEHTWGAHNSISEPDLPEVKEQWRIKRQFALDADNMSRALMGRWRPPAGPKNAENTVAVYNTNSWPRTDLVLLTRQQSTAGDWVVDEKGNALPSQRLTTGELAVLLENVPPFSGRQLIVRPGKANNRGSCKVSAGTLANSYLSLSIDPKRGGVESLTWGDKTIEWVDRTKGPGLNQYLYVPGKDARDAREPAGVKVRVKENGNLVASLLVEANAPGCKRYAAEYRVVDGLARVDIINQIDKARIREKEAIHLAFPFLLPDGQLRYDVANGIVRPESDQLAGSCKNFFSIQSWVDVSNSDRGVTWASVDAPLIEIGAITAEQPWAQKTKSSSRFYAYLMNNYWHTNYKADQEGPATFRFSILPHAGFRSEQAVRFGRECREPLVVVPDDQVAQPPASLFRVRPAEVLVSSLKPLPGGNAWLICLYNPTGTDQNAILDWDPLSAVTISSSDSWARAGAKISGEIKIAAWDSVYVRVEKGLARSR